MDLFEDQLIFKYRLDPSDPDSLKAWQYLRIKIIEDDNGSFKILKAIDQMNRAIIVCLAVIGYFVYKFIATGYQIYFNSFVQLTLAFLITIFVPVIYSLNSAVETMNLIDDGCKQKLKLLLVKQEILIQEA